MSPRRRLASLVLAAALSGAWSGCAAPPNTANRAPLVQAFDFSPKAGVKRGDFVSFTLAAADPEGQPLQYTWTATKGTLTSNAGSAVSWSPSRPDGSFEAGQTAVTVIVSDGLMTTTAITNILIDAEGNATLQPPIITSSDATPTGVAGAPVAPSAGVPQTGAPTALVTEAPRPVLTAVPGSAPTLLPGRPLEPTAGPTGAPTLQPEPEPTGTSPANEGPGPTMGPTAAPTAMPTVAPTAMPTPAPTAVPTAAPTPVPTMTPVATPVPTPTPTPTPTPRPVTVLLGEGFEAGLVNFDHKGRNDLLWGVRTDDAKVGVRAAAFQDGDGEVKPSSYDRNGSLYLKTPVRLGDATMPKLKFYVKGGAVPSTAATVQVYWVDEYCGGRMCLDGVFHAVGGPVTAGTSWSLKTVDLSSYVGREGFLEFRVMIRNSNGATFPGLMLDGITIED